MVANEVKEQDDVRGVFACEEIPEGSLVWSLDTAHNER